MSFYGTMAKRKTQPKDFEQLVKAGAELSVKWVTLNLDPIAVGEVNYRRLFFKIILEGEEMSDISV